MNIFCPNCGTALKPNDKFCDNCGKEVQKPILNKSSQTFCDNCGNKLNATDKFCDNCGKRLNSDFSKPNNVVIKTSTVAATPETITKNPPQNEAKEVPKSSNKMAIPILVVVILLAIIVPIIVNNHYKKKADSTIDTELSYNNSQSVVNVVCDNGNGGSGTIFTPDGIVLTNNHVITGSKQCQITIPNPSTGQPSKIYNATPVITPKLSQEYDVATLKIDGSYTDASGTTWGIYPTIFPAFTLSSTCNTSTQSQLNDSVRIYGYPETSGGYNLTVTDGVISSFGDDGSILTSAKVDSGNSGGLAVDQNGCWLGIPSAVVTGNYQNLGVIIPGSVVENFINGVPAKVEPIAASPNEDAETAPTTTGTPQESSDQVCQSGFGQYSEWTGKMGTDGGPLCDCQTGYAWDATGNTCASKISLSQYCQGQYGNGSYSYQQSGKAVCGCLTGYQWNSDQTSCVAQEDNNQVCQNKYGTNSQWSGQLDDSGQPTCDCQTGYTWDATGNSCASQSSLDQSCKNEYGDGSYSTQQDEKAVCGCTDGYQWNSNQSACVTAEASCPSNTDYNPKTEQCECVTGYTSVGGVCESDETYCQNTEGYASTYDSAKNQCDCDSGYIYSGGQCISSGY